MSEINLTEAENLYKKLQTNLKNARIENLIHSIKSYDVFQQLKNWKAAKQFFTG